METLEIDESFTESIARVERDLLWARGAGDAGPGLRRTSLPRGGRGRAGASYGVRMVTSGWTSASDGAMALDPNGSCTVGSAVILRHILDGRHLQVRRPPCPSREVPPSPHVAPRVLCRWCSSPAPSPGSVPPHRPRRPRRRASSAPTTPTRSFSSASPSRASAPTRRRSRQIADANDDEFYPGSRVAGTEGYAESVEYVAGKLRKAGYDVTLDPFDVPVRLPRAAASDHPRRRRLRDRDLHRLGQRRHHRQRHPGRHQPRPAAGEHERRARPPTSPGSTSAAPTTSPWSSAAPARSARRRSTPRPPVPRP